MNCTMDKSNKRFRPNPVASSLFSCTNKQCPNRYVGSTNHLQVDSNRVDMKCLSCNSSWVVCVTCKRRFSSKRTISYANKHFDEVHTSTVLTPCNVSNNSVHDTNDIVEQCLSTSSLPPKSQEFFSHQSKSLSHAVTHLVRQSFSQSSSSFNLPTIDESTFHLRLANIFTQLPSTLHLDIIQLLNDAKSLQMTSTRLPLSLNDVSRFYTKNKYALYNQLPIPICHVTAYHAFVHLRSMIEHYVAFGLHMDQNTNTVDNTV